jgi:hypothetical protein
MSLKVSLSHPFAWQGFIANARVVRSSSSTESKDQMESGTTFELIFACGLVVVPARPCCQSCVHHLLHPSLGLSLNIHLLSAEDEALLCWGNALLLLDTLLDARDLWVALCQPKCPGSPEVCRSSRAAEKEALSQRWYHTL